MFIVISILNLKKQKTDLCVVFSAEENCLLPVAGECHSTSVGFVYARERCEGILSMVKASDHS